MKPIHNRQPVILEPRDYAERLTHTERTETLNENRVSESPMSGLIAQPVGSLLCE